MGEVIVHVQPTNQVMETRHDKPLLSCRVQIPTESMKQRIGTLGDDGFIQIRLFTPGFDSQHLFWVRLLRIAPSFHGEWLRLEGGGVRFLTKGLGSSVSQTKTLA